MSSFESFQEKVGMDAFRDPLPELANTQVEGLEPGDLGVATEDFAAGLEESVREAVQSEPPAPATEPEVPAEQQPSEVPVRTVSDPDQPMVIPDGESSGGSGW